MTESTVASERAVSPVVAVILMVAITVILSAVVGAFVFDLGQSVGDSTDASSLGVRTSVQDANTVSVQVVTGEADELQVVVNGSVAKTVSDASAGDSVSVDANAESDISVISVTDGKERVISQDANPLTEATVATNSDPPQSGLVAYYDFESGSGSTVVDNAGSNDGTVNGGVWTTDAIEGASAMNFDGSSAHVRVNNIGALDGETEMTFSYWVKYDAHDQYDLSGYIDGSDHAIRLGSESGADAAFLNAGEHVDKNASQSFTTDRWYLLTLTSTVGDQWHVYVNDTRIGSGTGGIPSTSFYSIGAFGIGAALEDGNNDGTYDVRHPTNGTIDEVRLYNRSLSDSEVADLYNATK